MSDQHAVDILNRIKLMLCVFEHFLNTDSRVVDQKAIELKIVYRQESLFNSNLLAGTQVVQGWINQHTLMCLYTIFSGKDKTWEFCVILAARKN